MSSSDFNPTNVNLSSSDPAQIVCYLFASGNNYDGRLGERVASLFVILVISTAVTFFPVLAKRVKRLRIPLYVYLFARYFGAGVIIATAFVHLMDPAYAEIGPNTCVGMTGHWAEYSWPPAIILTTVMLIFLLDFGAERSVEIKYGAVYPTDIQTAIATTERAQGTGTIHVDDVETHRQEAEVANAEHQRKEAAAGLAEDNNSIAEERSFRSLSFISLLKVLELALGCLLYHSQKGVGYLTFSVSLMDLSHLSG